MYRDKIQDYNQHKEWLKDFFQGEFIHPNLLKIDSVKGDGFIFFYKIHPGIYFMFFHIEAKEDISFEFDYSSSFYFNYIASFFSNELKIRNDNNDLSSFSCDGYYVCSKDIVLNNSVKKGEKLHNVNIFFSEETFREIDDISISEHYLSLDHFFKYFDEYTDIKAFRSGLNEILKYSEILQAKILPVKMQELYYIFLNGLKSIQLPNSTIITTINSESLSKLFDFRKNLLNNYEEKPDLQELMISSNLINEESSLIFSEVFGSSPSSYYAENKLNKAKDDLLNHSLSISDLSKKYGFSHVQHFSTSFKRKFGYSPSDFLKNTL